MNRTDKPETDEIRDLLVEAGPPQPIPAADLAAIKSAARREFLAQSGSTIFEGQSMTPIVEGQSVTPIIEGRFSYRPVLAIAATLILVLTAVWQFRTGGSPIATTTVATVELLRGESAAAIGLEVGQKISAGEEIDTAAGAPTMVALRMASGHSVRLHANSKLRLDSDGRIQLERGAVYVDSGPNGAPSSLEIGTPHGTVREIGTQYEVRLGDDDDGTMRVRVREGSVSLNRSGEIFAASRGEELTIDKSGGVDRVAFTGADWSWVIAAAPAFDADGQTLAAYLTWVSRETGLEIVWDDPDLKIDMSTHSAFSTAATMVTPEETLPTILPAFGLDYRIDGNVLRVTRAD